MTEHSDTIGEVTHEGVTYEIDWPYDIEDEQSREDYAVVYLDGKQVAEFVNPNWGPFNDTEHVLELAQEFIDQGGVD